MLLGNSTRTALSCISTMRARYRRRRQLGRTSALPGQVRADSTAEVSLVALADLAQGLVDQGLAQVAAERGQLRQGVAPACRRASGLRWRSRGTITCSKMPASRSAALRQARRWRASTPWRGEAGGGPGHVQGGGVEVGGPADHDVRAVIRPYCCRSRRPWRRSRRTAAASSSALKVSASSPGAARLARPARLRARLAQAAAGRRAAPAGLRRRSGGRAAVDPAPGDGGRRDRLPPAAGPEAEPGPAPGGGGRARSPDGPGRPDRRGAA